MYQGNVQWWTRYLTSDRYFSSYSCNNFSEIHLTTSHIIILIISVRLKAVTIQWYYYADVGKQTTFFLHWHAKKCEPDHTKNNDILRVRNTVQKVWEMDVYFVSNVTVTCIVQRYEPASSFLSKYTRLKGDVPMSLFYVTYFLYRKLNSPRREFMRNARTYSHQLIKGLRNLTHKSNRSLEFMDQIYRKKAKNLLFQCSVIKIVPRFVQNLIFEHTNAGG